MFPISCQRRITRYFPGFCFSSGETGVRLQYSHARLHSLLQRAGAELDREASTRPLVEDSAMELVHVIGTITGSHFSNPSWVSSKRLWHGILKCVESYIVGSGGSVRCRLKLEKQAIDISPPAPRNSLFCNTSKLIKKDCQSLERSSCSRKC